MVSSTRRDIYVDDCMQSEHAAMREIVILLLCVCVYISFLAHVILRIAHLNELFSVCANKTTAKIR